MPPTPSPASLPVPPLAPSPALAARPTAGAGRPGGLVRDAGREPVAGGKALLYSHDTYGLGHLRRTLCIAARLSRSGLVRSQLVVTGSPMEHRFPLPPLTDSVKLPAVEKTGDERYAARSLGVDFAAIRALRQELILASARAFGPDLVLVDHAPAGLAGEIVPALGHLRRTSPATRLVLGLRDVLDDGARVRASWQAAGIHAILDDLYDRILVYGDPRVLDVGREYGLSDRAAAKVRYVGYLRREVPPKDRAEVVAMIRAPVERVVLVVAGGGGDGEQLLSLLIDAARSRFAPSGVGWLVVTGPLMAEPARRRLAERARSTASVRLVEFLPDIPETMHAVDGVVAMAGHNTVSEILSAGRPAVLVPRVRPRLEQWVRATRLEGLGLVRTLHPDDATPGSVAVAVARVLERPAPVVPEGLLDGLPRLERELAPLLSRTGATYAVAG